MCAHLDNYSIKENSGIAAIAGFLLRERPMATVIGKSIHLSGISKSDFLKNGKWLKHELCHVAQFKKYGTFRFIFLYIWETICHGYTQNRFEKEAREFAESNP